MRISRRRSSRELWSRIHQKAVYAVQFETAELIAKCVAELDAELKVAPLQYVVQARRADCRSQL